MALSRRGLTLIATVVASLALSSGCTHAPSTTRSPPAPTSPLSPGTTSRVTPMTDISFAGCPVGPGGPNGPGGNAEVEEATAAPAYVYVVWIGCGGIGFARSADDGAHFDTAVTVPGSGGHSWDPAITVAHDGSVYVSFMLSTGPLKAPGVFMNPVVAVSGDHGATFSQAYQVRPPAGGNWGDRDFIAAGPHGELYLTWDYGPSAAEVQTLCNAAGSCGYSAGDLNAVIETSADGGRTWGSITPLGPGYPLGGGYSAPLVVSPDGKLDVLYDGHPENPRTGALGPGYEFFTASADGTHWPASPMKLWPGNGTLSLPDWWIDGDISTDSAGDLYATWDTQTSAGDIGWLTDSADGGRTWSAPVRVTPDSTGAPHITESAGGPPGIAYVGWQTSAPRQGYATYLRPFSITRGWLGPVIQVSTAYGKAAIWPGDTFGIAVLPDGRITLTWGSAIGGNTSQIYSSVVTLAR